MLRVVIDTNVVISAAIAMDSFPSKVFELFLEGRIMNYASDEIFDEMKDVAFRPKMRACADFGFILENFRKYSIFIRPHIKLNVVDDDPKDDKFIECAVCSGADCIISGDRHLLGLGEFENVRIVSPREFIKSVYPGHHGQD